VTLTIDVDDLAGREIQEFLAAHLEDMRALCPPESIHALDLDGLRRPEVTFWAARDGAGALVGCGAIKRLDAAHAEIKSMRTAPEARGTGVASALLGHMMVEARGEGLARLSLETGPRPEFGAAHALYLRAGFTYTGPFADYTDDPNSVYMTRAL
jgi:putative acetyltransferase